MIGSPAARGAVASVGGAGCACLAAAPAVSPVSAAIAASVTMAGGPQRRIATVDCVVVNRFAMPCPGRNACRARVLSYTTARAGGRWYAAEFDAVLIGRSVAF